MYTPNANTFLHASPKFTITRARRFDYSFVTSDNKSNRLLNKSDLSTISTGRSVKGGAFGRERRFAGGSHIEHRLATPGPADYMSLFTSRAAMPKTSFTKAKRSFRYTFEKTPGPANYEPKLYTKKSPITLPRVMFDMKTSIN